MAFLVQLFCFYILPAAKYCMSLMMVYENMTIARPIRLYLIHSLALLAALVSVPPWSTYLSQLITNPKNAIVPIKNVAARNRSATKRPGSFASAGSMSFLIPIRAL